MEKFKVSDCVGFLIDIESHEGHVTHVDEDTKTVSVFVSYMGMVDNIPMEEISLINKNK